MNITGKKYKSKDKKGLGGLIGTGLGAGAGFLAGNPALGAKVGGMAGNFVEDQIADDPKQEQKQPISYTPSSYGYADGGFLDFSGSMPQSGGYPKEEKKMMKKGGAIPTNLSSPIQQAYQQGKAKPIGQDAVEMKGPSHEQGGVDIDENTELEGKETVDNVDGQDYAFSKRLKVPGSDKSFAQVHKEMVKNNASPQHIEKLAKLQEKIAGRDEV